MINKILIFMVGFIPKYIGNHIVIHFFELLRKFQIFTHKHRDKNFKINSTAFENHKDFILKNNGYIEDQHSYFDMPYGKATMDGCGCEIIAVYNALNNMQSKHSIKITLPELISAFEKDGMVLTGRFGTSPGALRDFFASAGFQTILTVREYEFKSIADEYDSLVFTMYNDKNNIMKEVHTVNISKENGLFTAHNVYCNGSIAGPYENFLQLMSAINGGQIKGISLIGIRTA